MDVRIRFGLFCSFVNIPQKVMATTRLHTLLLGGPLSLLIRVLMVYFTSLLKGAFGDSESNFSEAIFYVQPKRERPAVSKIVIKCLHDLSGVCFFLFSFFFFPLPCFIL